MSADRDYFPGLSSAGLASSFFSSAFGSWTAGAEVAEFLAGLHGGLDFLAVEAAVLVGVILLDEGLALCLAGLVRGLLFFLVELAVLVLVEFGDLLLERLLGAGAHGAAHRGAFLVAELAVAVLVEFLQHGGGDLARAAVRASAVFLCVGQGGAGNGEGEGDPSDVRLHGSNRL
jgi:hypothetical protein